ncbi:bifunctional metallophosphatase/5'-nucleotidase [Candidatus Epulonipiscium viviparus]|uniref:bifunctional metallophosphatase/5'-nucleotidase n=1 Tax=Candidatus Epulonipiscium viviparus TaxID=420336 RepID=UPI0027380B3E|nr:5'-nucleotidase C-terminal domain-containing protein [Candidatus Epulopiscium viviparus]
MTFATVIDGEVIQNAAGEDVILTQTGAKFDNIGKITINPSTNEIRAELIAEYEPKDKAVSDFIAKETEAFEKMLTEVVAISDISLTTADPVTGQAIIRVRETNLGNFAADAYRSALETDVAIVNAGGIRATIEAGEITLEDIINVHPWGNDTMSVLATGQTILNALEMGAKSMPSGSGGFLHVSGMTYAIDTTIPSSVVTDSKGAFVEVAGAYRVKDVIIGGEPLDLDKEYSVASHNYLLLEAGDGMSMFLGAPILKDKFKVDNEVLIDYIQNDLGGTITEKYANPYGEGRITIITEHNGPEDDKPDAEESTTASAEEVEVPIAVVEESAEEVEVPIAIVEESAKATAEEVEVPIAIVEESATAEEVEVPIAIVEESAKASAEEVEVPIAVVEESATASAEEVEVPIAIVEESATSRRS